MLLPDYPIENKEADKLHRTPLATKVAELIENFQGKESFVIGIEGIWGSGKTSFINLVTSQIDKEKTTVITFNPWNFSGQNELISDFFGTLIVSIEQFRLDKKISKQMKGIVSKLTRKSEVSFSPEISFWGVKVKANDLLKFGGEEKTLQEERKEIDSLFVGLEKKVVIVIDDIDRLDTEETRLIMKLVKMTANFPNTVFLLAYDREKVAERLGDKGVGDEYLKKIIQVSFTLPKPDEQGLRNMLFSDLDTTISGIYGETKLEGENEKRRWQIVYLGFPSLFITIRDIKRFVSSLRLNWSILGKEEINMIDFIAIEAIRVFSPAFYSAISANKTLFTTTESSIHSYRPDNKKTKSGHYQELLEKVPENIRPVIDKICKELFPQLETGYGHDWQKNWRLEKRICAEERFNFYFQLGIPEGAISEIEITEVLKSLEKEDDFTETLLRYQTDKRIRSLLTKLLDYVEKLEKDKVKNLILSLWNSEKKIKDEHEGGFDFDDIETQSLRLPYHAIKNNIGKIDRSVFISEIVDETKNLYPPVNFVAFLDQELQKERRMEEDYLVQKSDIVEVKNILIERIREASKNGDLQKEVRFASLLYKWKEWDLQDGAKEYVSNLIKTKTGLSSFLKGFVGKVYSSNGNRNEINRNGLYDFVPQTELEELVKTITDEDLQSFSENKREAIILFRAQKKSMLE